MRDVIIRALTKHKGKSPEDLADIIIDYFEILGLYQAASVVAPKSASYSSDGYDDDDNETLDETVDIAQVLTKREPVELDTLISAATNNMPAAASFIVDGQNKPIDCTLAVNKLEHDVQGVSIRYFLKADLTKEVVRCPIMCEEWPVDWNIVFKQIQEMVNNMYRPRTVSARLPQQVSYRDLEMTASV